MFDGSAGLLERMSSAQRAERAATAARLIEVGEFTCRRIEDTTDEDDSCVDECRQERNINAARYAADPPPF